jgi:hypothetical protein
LSAACPGTAASSLPPCAGPPRSRCCSGRTYSAVPRDLDGHPFAHAGAYHVADGSPPEVVEQRPRDVGRLASRRPRLAEVHDRLAL